MENQIETITPTDKQLEEIKSGARILFNPKQLVEVRIRLWDGYWRGFYFNDHERMAQVVYQLDQDSRIQSIYYVFNEIDQKLAEYRQKCGCDKCIRGGLIVANPTDEQVEKILTGPTQHLTENDDVKNIRWIFIDVDTMRAKGFEHESSTAEEKRETQKVAQRIIKYLDSKGWPNALLADSGNGYHILPRINQGNTQTNIELLVDCLRALTKFNSDAAKVDDAVFNPARLTRAYGTTTRKGTSTEQRPYRRNRIIPPQGAISVVQFDQILELGGCAPKAEKARGEMPLVLPDFDPQDFFDYYAKLNAFHITGETTWQGKPIKVTDICITAGHKHTGSGLTGFIIGDTFGYHCFSDDCTGVTIADVLRRLNEEYDPYPHSIWPDDSLNWANIDAAEEAVIEDAKTFAAEEISDEPDKPALATPSRSEDTEEVEISNQAVAGDASDEAVIKIAPPQKDKKKKKLKPGEKKRLKSALPNELTCQIIAMVLEDPVNTAPDFLAVIEKLRQVESLVKIRIAAVLDAIFQYYGAYKKLPNRVQLKDYLLNDTDFSNASGMKELLEFVDGVKFDPGRTFAVTARRLFQEIDYIDEKVAWLTGWDYLKNEELAVADRMDIAKQIMVGRWQSTINTSPELRAEPWQRSAYEIFESFQLDVRGSNDRRKFKTGFPTIDNSGMNVGLDGERFIGVYGPAGSRKSTTVLSLAMNFARQGKHGLFLAGEHLRMKVLKRLTLMYAYHLRDNPEVGLLPTLSGWEGLNCVATEDDLVKLNIVLNELYNMTAVPGLLQVQNINNLTRGSEDKWAAIEGYIEASFQKMPYDFVVIDPLDSVMPVSGLGESHWIECAEMLERLFDFSRDFHGNEERGRGMLILGTAQFNSKARREIEKVQQKNEGPDKYYDDLEALMKQDSFIQYFTTIGQKCDLAIGVCPYIKNGSRGMLIQGRQRDGGNFNSLEFQIDENSNLMIEAEDGFLVKRVNPEQLVQERIMPLDSYDEGL